LEQRLAHLLRIEPENITSAASGTAALVGAILAVAGRATQKRPLAIIPSYTFIATAAAIEQCGYRPYLADIEAGSWMLDPERLKHFERLDEVGLVVPVAPFGRPVAQEQWEIFNNQTGIPVAIDGAASIEGLVSASDLYVGNVPVALSFHATKSFATGEGGAVVSTDASLVERAMRALNFGFNGDRNSRSSSINGKMSEYHAAIGLAEIDGWQIKRDAFQAVNRAYRKYLRRKGLEKLFYSSPEVSSCYGLFDCTKPELALRAGKKLNEGGIDFRFWYGSGLHRQTYLADAVRDEMNVTDNVAARIIGLPIATDLPERTIARITELLTSALLPTRTSSPPSKASSFIGSSISC